jgi:O-glycosyl hydrolase
MSKTWLHSLALASLLVGCGNSNNGGGTGGSSASSSVSSGGQSGGSSSSKSSGGSSSASSSSSSGGSSDSGGSSSSGGTSSGGASTTGGKSSGGAGGTTNKTGGTTGTGGKAGAGGTSDDGGTTDAGGTSGKGGAGGGTGGKGGTTGTGGTTGSGGSGTGGSSVNGVTVLLENKHQTIEGFGLNTALGGGSVPWDTLYSTTGNGLGFSIVRVGMNSNGSLSGSKPPSSYNAKTIGSVWTAPANCKDNNSENKGGHLLKTCYDSFSTTVANFAKSQGLYAMSGSNEPDFASCGSTIGPPCNGDYVTMVFTAKEMVEWVKVLGPKLKANGVKLIAPEPSEWIHLWSNASATGSTVTSHPNSSDPLGCGCFSNTPTTTGCASKCENGDGYDYGHWLAKDATAWGLIDILGTHEYDTQKAEAWPADVDGGKRTKTVYQTEVSGVMYWPEQGFSSDIKNGIVVAGWVHSGLVVGEASGWLYWWYQPGGNDNEGLVSSSGGALTKRAYTIGNYSKFVRPGAVMVEVAGNSNKDLLLSAFTGTEGTIIVGINKGTTDLSIPIAISGGTAPASCTPYVTSANDNLKAGTAVTVTGGTVTAAFGGQTVTTFVCK